VFPMARRVAAVQADQRAAAARLRVAEQEFGSVTTAVQRQQVAETNLARFYADVLPAGLSAARGQTYLRLSRLAADAGLRTQRRIESVDEPKDAGQGQERVLTRFETAMVLRGDYDGVRQFIRDVEMSDEFIVIDNISLSEGAGLDSPLELSLVMSTYYLADRHGR
jgi:Tfp pilus assembly protein PilO